MPAPQAADDSGRAAKWSRPTEMDECDSTPVARWIFAGRRAGHPLVALIYFSPNYPLHGNRRMNPVFRLALATIAAVTGIATLAGAQTSGAPLASRDTHSDSVAVASAVSQFHEALTRGDSVSALSFLASDAVVLEGGSMESRSEYRSHHLSSDIKFAQAVRSVRSPIKVVVSGETAWTTGTSTAQGEFNGRAINSTGAELMVLTRTPTGWKIRSIHWSSRSRRTTP